MCVSILHLPATRAITLQSNKVCLPRLCPTRVRHSVTVVIIALKGIASKKFKQITSTSELSGNSHDAVRECVTITNHLDNIQPNAARIHPCASECPRSRPLQGTKLRLVAFSLPRFAKSLSKRRWLTLEASHIAIPFAAAVSSLELGQVM